MEKILTSDQLEVVSTYKRKYNIDITNGWFNFDISTGEDGFDFFVCIQPAADTTFDQDSMCDDFFPKDISLDYYAETIYGYEGDKQILIDSLTQTGFFKQI